MAGKEGLTIKTYTASFATQLLKALKERDCGIRLQRFLIPAHNVLALTPACATSTDSVGFMQPPYWPLP